MRLESTWKCLIYLASALAVLAPYAVAQTAGGGYEGRRIRGLSFDPAPTGAAPEELLRLLPLKPGDLYSAEGVRAAMGVLFQSGRFIDIEADAQMDGEAVNLVFRTTPASFVGSLDIDGKLGTLSRGELLNAAKLPLGVPFEEGLAIQALESMENELRLDGFYSGAVSYRLERDLQHGQVNIRFLVEPGPRARFATPVFKGTLLFPEPKLVARASWKRYFGLGGWSYVSDQKVQSGVRRIRQLFGKEDYLMAAVSVDRLDFQPERNVAVPNVRIDPGPKVELRLEGAKISRKNLRTLVPIYEEQSVDKDLLLEGARKIASALRARGFFENKVNYRVEQEGQPVDDIDPTKNTAILYTVERGTRFKVSRVLLSGNRYFDDETLRERMAVKPATLLRYRRGRFSDELLAGDATAITELYRGNGFLEAAVKTEVLKQQQEGHLEVEVRLDITEGTQTLIEELALEGVGESDRAFLAPVISSTPGQPFSVLTINTDRERILGLLYQNGYSAATFESVVERPPGGSGIRLVYKINGGPQNFVREVLITGLKITNRDLVEKRIQLAPGAPLNNTEVYAAQRKLYDLGIFARVDAAQQNPDGLEISKTILFNLEEASRISFNGGLGAEIARIGGGITSLDSPAGGTGFSPRISFGVNRTNFWGLGHTIGAQTRLSNIQRRVLLTYLAPQFRDSDRYAVTLTALYDDARNVRTYNSKRLEGSLQLAQRLDLANSVQYRVTYRDVRIDANTIKIDPSLIPILVQPVRVGSVSSTFIQDRRDDPLDAKRGRYTTVDFGVASKALASSANFLRLLARNSSYYKIGRELVFARSLTFGLLSPYGSTSNLDPATNIPLPERFFSGGANAHRGFPENQAGPRDLVTGFPIGGKAILMNNLELRFPLLGDNIGGVLFHDAGNVYSGAGKINFRWSQKDLSDFDYMVHAVGFGIRYRTPIGPVRVDLALSPNSARFNGFEGSREDLLFGRGRATQLRVSRFQFHISLGQAF